MMKYLKGGFALLFLLYLQRFTEAQLQCPDGEVLKQTEFGPFELTCCVPYAISESADCIMDGGSMIVATISTTCTPPSTLPRSTRIVKFTRPRGTPEIVTMTKQTITTTTPTIPPLTMPTTITTVPNVTSPGNDVDEGSGDETNGGNIGEGETNQNTASAGLSIGIPLVVLAVVVVAVLLVRFKYKRRKESIGNKLTTNDRAFLQSPAGGPGAANDGVYQNLEQNVNTSPPLDTYDNLHLYGNTVEAPHAYEQVPEKRDPLAYESLHVYSNPQIGQADYDTPEASVKYANLGVQIRK